MTIGSGCRKFSILFIFFVCVFWKIEWGDAAPRPAAILRGTASVSRKQVRTSSSFSNTALSAGDTVQTGARGRATLQFDDGSRVDMDANSSLSITRPGGSKSGAIFQANKGRMVVRLSSGKKVETRTALVRVRGTEIHLTVAEDGTTALAVLEGEAEFSNAFGAVVVEAGQESVATENAAPTKPVTIQNPGLLLEWTLDIERVVLPREFYYSHLDARAAQAALATRQADAAAEPQSAERQQALGEALYDARHYEQALAAFQEANRLTPGTAAVVGIGQSLLALGRIGEAEEALLAAREAPSAQVALAEVELSRDRPQVAEKYARQAAAAPRAATLLGVALMRQPGRLAEAAAVLQKAVESEPENWRYQTRSWLALVHLAQDDLAAALREGQKAVAAQPESGLAHGNLALVEFFAGNARQAERAGRRAVALNPKSVAARVALGQALLARGDVDEAQRQAMIAVTLDPRLPQSRYLLGVADASRRDWSHAARELRESLRMAPQFLPAVSALARVYNEMGRRNEALAVVKEQLAQRPDAPEVRVALGEVLYQQSRYKEPVEQYELAVKARPSSALYHAVLARALLDANRMNEAINAGRKAVSLAPQVAQYHALLGQIYDFSGQGAGNLLGFTGLRANAEREFRSALTLDPQNALARLGLGTMQTDSDPSTTLNAITQALVFDPTVVRQVERGGVKLGLDGLIGDRGNRSAIARYRDEALDGRFHTFSALQHDDIEGESAKHQTRSTLLGTFNTFAPDPKTTVFAAGIHFRERETLPGPLILGSDLDDSKKTRLTLPSITARRRLGAGAHLWLGAGYQTFQGQNAIADLSRSIPIQSNLQSQFADLFPAGILLNPVAQQSSMRQPQTEIRADFTLGRDTEKPTLLSVGAGHLRSHFTSRQNLRLVDEANTLFGRVQGITGAEVPKTVVYTQLSRSLSDRLSVVAQLRGQWSKQEALSRLVDAAGNTVRGPLQSSRQSNWLPSMVATYQADSRTLLRLFANRRTADLAGFALAPTDTLFTAESDVLPHFDLFDLAEIFQVDAERYGEKGFYKLFAFHSQARGLSIGSDSPSILFEFRSDSFAVNLPRVDRTGIGARVERRLTDRLFGNLLVVGSRNVARAPGTRYDNQTAPYQPKFRAVAGVDYIDPSGNKFGFYARHSSRIFQDSPLFEALNPGAPRPRFPSRTLFDFRIGREPNVHHEVFFAVSNIFDKPVVTFEGFPTSGRRFEAGYTRRF